jgi:hypothetical protein
MLTKRTAIAYVRDHFADHHCVICQATQYVLDGVDAVDVRFFLRENPAADHGATYGNCAGLMTVWVQNGALYGEW